MADAQAGAAACPLRFDIGGMHCAACSSRIERVTGRLPDVEKAVSAIPGVKSATVDLDKKELQYEEEDKNMPIALDIIKGAIRDLGYEPENQRP